MDKDKCQTDIENSFVEICASPIDAVAEIKSEASILVGGFGLCGVPETLLRALVDTKVRDLTIVSNEGGVKHHGLDMLFETKQIRKMVCSFIGENKVYTMLCIYQVIINNKNG